MKPALLAIALLFSLVSCATKLTPSSYAKLPESSGWYTGSRHISTLMPWIYRGTDEQGHHFRYTWLRDNSVFERNIIAGQSIFIDQPFPLSEDPAQWQSAKPVLRSDGKLDRFETTPLYQSSKTELDKLLQTWR